MIYISTNTQVLKDYFYTYLTAPTQEFFTQFQHDTDQPFSEDGGLVISEKELAHRLGFWDNFLKKYPGHLFADHAKSTRGTYLYFFLIGLDNTPAYNYESGKITPEFLEAYRYFTEKYPSAESASVLKKYMELLEKSGYTRNKVVEDFIEHYNIYSGN